MGLLDIFRGKREHFRDPDAPWLSRAEYDYLKKLTKRRNLLEGSHYILGDRDKQEVDYIDKLLEPYDNYLAWGQNQEWSGDTGGNIVVQVRRDVGVID